MEIKNALLRAGVVLVLQGCSDERPLTSEEVLTDSCRRYARRSSPARRTRFRTSECRQAMAVSFGAAAVDPDFDAALQITRPELDGCLAALEAMQCDRFTGTPPEACGFIRRRTE